MKGTLLLIVLLFPIVLLAQVNNLSGKIIDGKTGNALPYVNIGVVGKNAGTVSAPDGRFSLRIPSNLNAAELRISMVGYEARSFSVSEFKENLQSNPVVELMPVSIALQEVVVRPKFDETRILGNETTSTNVTGGFAVDTLGREIGIIVRLKKKYRPATPLKFRASVALSEYDTIRFRLNFYNLKRGMPDQKLVTENIIITRTFEQGIIEVDLEDYGIRIEDDFCVALEWIEDFGDNGNDLNFSFALFGNRMVYRSTSQDIWRDFRLLTPGLNVTIGY
ncbi:MAG: carboxypeptidase-like regulatory domain-containing protein [Bacteroidota bacterium]